MRGTVLVTGCAGLVGRGITRFLLAQGYRILGTSRRALISRHPGFTPLRMDLADPACGGKLAGFLEEADAVIHNAALLPHGIDLPEGRLLEVNTLGTVRLLAAMAAGGARKHALLISGTAVLKPDDDLREDAPYAPGNEYLTSKVAQEAIFRQFQAQGRADCAVLRIQAPYGFGGGNPAAVIPRFQALAARSEDITLWGTGSREQGFTFVEDVGLACHLAMERRASGAYNIPGGPPATMLELARAVLALHPGSGSRIVFSGKPDPQEGRRAPRMGMKAERELGYRPRHSLAEGLAKSAALASGLEPLFFGMEGDRT